MPIRRRNEKVLRPVRPNIGIQADYRRRIERLVAEMQRSYAYFLGAQYRETPPEMAHDILAMHATLHNMGVEPPYHRYMAVDASPAAELMKEIKKLGKRWESRFEAMAPKLAAYFATAIKNRSEAALMKILKDGGITVKFKMTKAMRDIVDATVAENVSLIKSIQSEYHTKIEGLVMRSVTAGRDLSELSKELQKQFGVTKRRAALISRDQNNKATAVLSRARQMEAGLTEAIWLHSLGGKEPRKTHLANNGKRYKIADGWYDPDPKVKKHIWPGELINCRCVAKPVVKGFS